MPTLTKTFTCGSVVSLSKDFKKSLSLSLKDENVANMSDDDLRSYLSPNPEDYVLIPFRALSAAPDVQQNTINFAHNDGAALKEAVDMFNGLVILKDHDMSVDNWLGKTQGAYWDDSIPNAPPGVNFMLRVDTKADPKVARGLISGMLESGSVTIQFDYDKSHPKMEEYEFYSQMGQTVKGKLVQALVTKVTRCYEYSIVWQGADKSAKKINPDGSINKPGLSLDVTEEAMLKKLAISLGLPETATEDEVNIALQAKLAAETAAATAKVAAETQVTTLTATIATKDTELATKATEVTTLTAKVTTLEAEKVALTTANAALESKQTAFAAHLSARRAEALRLYNLAEGDKALEPMRTAINAADLAVAESFVTTYEAKANSEFPLACAKCHSTEVSRRKSTPTQESDDNKDTKVASYAAAAVKSIHG